MEKITMNDNTKSNDLATATGTIKNTTEHGALKTIHKEYNKLSGYEAMLHIISRFRFVLYPFIFLSVAGSSYSFYNDFLKAFPMLPDYLTLTISIFFSIMLEIVRDGSLIALFNAKMKIPSRALVIIIFLAVTTYLYSSHLKAIKVIEKASIEYALAHQDQSTLKATNPKYDLAVTELSDLKQDLKDKKAEKTDDLIKNSTSIHTKKRNDALDRIDKIDTKIEEIKSKIASKQIEIIGYKNSNIKDVEDTQKIISNILLATLILIETLAMLGAVIKFINKDNADKEIAKHKEIVEEYVAISEQMKADNEELTKNLSSTVQAQSQSNQQVMQMMSDDMKQTSAQNVQFLEMMAQNKQQTMQQLNQVLEFVAKGNQIDPYAMQTASTPTAEPIQEERKIGFQASSKEEMLSILFGNGEINPSEKLAPKSLVVDITKRQENQRLTDFYKELVNIGVIENRVGKGYYAITDYQTALKAI